MSYGFFKLSGATEVSISIFSIENGKVNDVADFERHLHIKFGSQILKVAELNCTSADLLIQILWEGLPTSRLTCADFESATTKCEEMVDPYCQLKTINPSTKKNSQIFFIFPQKLQSLLTTSVKAPLDYAFILHQNILSL